MTLLPDRFLSGGPELAEQQLALLLQEGHERLQSARTLVEARRIEGFSRAIIELARQQEGLSMALRNEAAFLWMEARAAQGELLRRMDRRGRGREKTPTNGVFSPTLRDLGYRDQEAQRLQLLASVDVATRRRLLEKANTEGQKLTQKAILAAAPSRLTPAAANGKSSSGEREASLSWPEGRLPLNQIICGDARQLAALIPDQSISLCLCDPVYDRIEDYEWLAKECERILVPGGSLIAQCGNTYRYDAETALRKSGLEFVDLLAEVYPYSISRLFKAKVFVGWKPHLWFSRGPRSSGWVMNRLTVGGKHQADPAKALHPWADGEEFAFGCVTKLTLPEGLVWDPFSGSGTVPAVCRRAGRPFLAFEIDSYLAEQANRRLEQNAPTDWEAAQTQLDFAAVS